MPNVHNLLNPPRETGSASAGNMAPRVAASTPPSTSVVPASAAPRRNGGGTPILSSSAHPPGAGAPAPNPNPNPAPKRNSGPVALPQTPAQPHATPIPPKRPSGSHPLPIAPQQNALPKRNSGPIPLPNTPTTPMQQLARTPRRHSGPQVLPSAAQDSAQSMNHHYPDVHAKAGPAPMSPLSPMAAPRKPQTTIIPKRQSGPQPIERRKTPPVLPASPSPLRQSGPQVIERRVTPPVLQAASQPKRQSGPHSLTAPLSVPAPAASGTRRGTEILPRNAPVQTPAPRERYQPSWYSVHARTLVLSVCVAAALAYMNFRPSAIIRCQTIHKDNGEAKITSYVTEIRGRGWPLTQTQTVETSDPILAMEAWQKEPPKPIGAKNILICLALILGTGALCEFLTRRSENATL